MSIQQHLEWLGFKVRDRVTELEGVVTSVSLDIGGCVQGYIQQQGTDEKGELLPGRWVDTTRLTKLSHDRVMEPVPMKHHEMAAPPGPSDKSAPSR